MQKRFFLFSILDAAASAAASCAATSAGEAITSKSEAEKKLGAVDVEITVVLVTRKITLVA